MSIEEEHRKKLEKLQDIREELKQKGLKDSLDNVLKETFNHEKYSADGLYITKHFARKIFLQSFSDLFFLPKHDNKYTFSNYNRNKSLESENISFKKSEYTLHNWIKNYLDFKGNESKDKQTLEYSNELNALKCNIFPHEYFYMKFIWLRLNDDIVYSRLKSYEDKLNLTEYRRMTKKDGKQNI